MILHIIQKPFRFSKITVEDYFVKGLAFLVVVAATLCPGTVLAATANSLGDVFCNVAETGSSYPGILTAVSYIIGSFLAVRSILLFKKHGENPNQSQLVPAIAQFVVAGFFLSLPAFAGLIQRTIMGDVTETTSTCEAGPLGSASSLDVMMSNFVKNVHGPIFILLSAIAILVGLTYIVRGLMAGAKTGTDPRSAAPKTIVSNLVIGAILISIGGILPDTLNSLFGTNEISNMNSFAGISWSGIVGTGVNTTAADNTIKAILAFIQIVGGIAFLRGWLIVKQAVEGGGQATIPQGLTHIIGGAMAIKIDTMLEIFDKTFGTNLIN